MLSLKRFYGKYDVVICLFSTFGYFYQNQDNEDCLQEMRRCLKPGGRLVLQVTNKNWRLSEWSEGDWIENKKKLIMEIQKFDKKNSCVESQLAVIEKRKKRVWHYFSRMKIYSIPEMKSLLKKCGFRVEAVWDDLSSSRKAKTLSSHPVFICQV